MTRDDIIRMAEDAGFTGMTDHPALARFAELVAAAEREACASICFQEGPSIDGELIAEAIRARGEK